MSTRALQPGDQFGPTTVTVTRETLIEYAAASGDHNPIHWSDRQARALGLDGVIAHGMWTMGRALSVVTDWLGDSSVVSGYFVRFTKPVPVPDDDRGTEVVFSGVVSAADDDLVTITVNATCGDDKVLGAAKVEVRR